MGKTEIIIMATRTQNVLGEKGRRIRELTSVVQKRFNFPENSVDLYAEKVATRGLCAIAQCESLRYKLIGGLAVRRACYGVLRFIMESGAKGCEVVVFWKAPWTESQGDEVRRWSHDPLRRPRQPLCRHRLSSRPAASGSHRHQGENHASLGSPRQDGTQDANPRSRVHRGAKGREHSSKSLLRGKGRQARCSPCKHVITCSGHVLTCSLL